MSVELFHGAEIEPTDEVLEKILGVEMYNVYRELLKIGSEEFDLRYEWDLNNKHGNWLCEACYLHKIMYFFRILDTSNSIKTSFYFVSGTEEGIFDLPINENIKETYRKMDMLCIGKPLKLEINRKEQLNDFREIVRYMKNQFILRRKHSLQLAVWRNGGSNPAEKAVRK